MHGYRFATINWHDNSIFDIGNNATSGIMVEYSANMKINAAYSKMTSNIAAILETANMNFKRLRRACIQEIHALGSTLPKSLVHKIQPTESLDDMLDVLAPSPYWNWFDTRLLQALVSASGSPKAEQWLEIFKATFYTKKVTEVIPYISIKPFKGSVDIVEKFDKNPKDLTISELLEHKYKLEYEVLDIDEGELVLSCIKTGCVELTWQIPQELVYQAYTSMKRKHDELSSLAVKSLDCKAADELSDLPILWRGQEVEEVGPIESLPEHVRKIPYSLPQGFHWVTLNSSNSEKIARFIVRNNSDLNDFPVKCLLKYPNAINELQLSIQTTNNKLAGIVLAKCVDISIGKTSVKCLNPTVVVHRKYKRKRMFYMLNKELMRRANLNDVNQFVVFNNPLVKPVVTYFLWKYQFNHPATSQLPSSPRTPGWRRMTSEDVPSALALINKWSSQFEIRQVLKNEEECSYCFLDMSQDGPNLNVQVFTYVVQNKSNEITDLVRYLLYSNEQGPICASSIVLVSMVSPVEQLIVDTLVCARKSGATYAVIHQHDIRSDILLSLSFQQEQGISGHLYNYKYFEIPYHKFWFAPL